MESIVKKKYQQMYGKVKSEMAHWEELQSLLVSLFSNTCSMIQLLPMAATYAALVSLMNALIRIQHPTCPASFRRSQLQSLFHKTKFLVDFLESSSYSRKVNRDFEKEMARVAYAAQDTIESYVADQILARSSHNKHKAHALLFKDLEKEIQQMDLIIQQALKFKPILIADEREQLLQGSLTRVGSPPGGMVKMVGLDDELNGLIEQLTNDQSSRQIIPIVGMGGIGKTTLAQNVYSHPYAKYHFHLRAWVTISQDYTIGGMIHSLLYDIGIHVKGKIGDEELGHKLYKGLCGRRYLIILDDIWSGAVWDEMRRFIPDNNNGSRVVLTTRHASVALGVGTCSPYKLMLLNNDESWKLLFGIVFGRQVCPPELERLGKIIAKGCKGLPLAIVVIGGFLKMSELTQEYWEGVTKNVTSIINKENDGHCLEVLSLSYNHLPIHLKPCFLYMATFKGDVQIPVSEIINLWVADGFIKTSTDRVLEEVALEYLNDLIGRNLVLVKEQRGRMSTRSCIVHELLREFCAREAQKEKFLGHMKEDVIDLPRREGSVRRLVYHLSDYNCSANWRHTYSFVCNYHSSHFSSNPRIVQVFRIDDDKFLTVDTARLVQLRYLACSPRYVNVRGKFSLFWNLETLIVDTIYVMKLDLPAEFWELHNLRHLIVSGGEAVLPDSRVAQVGRILDNLQTLSGVEIFRHAGDEVLKIIPNLKELRIFDNGDEESRLADSILSLVLLHKLGKLSIEFHYFQSEVTSRKRLSNLHEEFARCALNGPENLAFSRNLRELELSGSYIMWDHITVIGSLPNLEVLKLKHKAFVGEEWNSNEGEFQRLKYLSIETCKLRIWRAEGPHFPRLERLILRYLDLEEIPWGIGELATLGRIKLITSVKSIVISAKEILNERESLGYSDDLLIQAVYLKGLNQDNDELEKLASYNFRISF